MDLASSCKVRDAPARNICQGERFEMPYDIECDGCYSMIAKGVWLNAQIKQVGNYDSIKIWRFTMKAPCCSHEIVIQTDSQNSEFLIISGACIKIQDRDDDYEDLYWSDDDGFTADGEPIDKEVLRKYLKQVKESQGFDIIDYPGFIPEVTYIVPVIDDIGIGIDLDEVMGMAALAVATYNEDHKTEFKVVGVEKLNSELRGVFFDYYITFSAVEVKGCWEQYKGSPVQPESAGKKLDVQKLKSLIAKENELDETAARKTFQAVVFKQFVEREYGISFCRAAGVSGNSFVPRSKSCACSY